ncbi:tetraacyldisaccharide 4'-kinase [Thalassomonas haliotis]|uniref:Tetraacyldisaccharide 4'-kinase n=1 Tax=Thalassomonas haliotis TaxID=485448 RepID=A0ABY7VI35_9GAMM|nr:tetraacyldisaccharide 4'-kinase [Thalassomonas haliotis]WDE13394.1 tetraacyldisaccharide 4'-kinase [Thalassomonas haliotis]
MRLIEKVWFFRHPAKYLLVPLLLPLTLVFALVSCLRRWAYRLGLKKTGHLDKPVIVVGNIGIGGNGKTPVVIFLVKLCRSLGLNPGVISRGYGGQAGSYPYLLDENSTAEVAGDEPVLIYQRCLAPVAVGADRIASGQLLLEQGCDIIIADDGLQHYRLPRQLELIVVDGKRRFGNGLLLPAGPLREGKRRLKQADCIIYNGVTENNLGQEKIHGRAENISMLLAPGSVCHLTTGELLPIAEFLQKFPQVNAMAGIGDPGRFFSTLTTQGFVLNQAQGFNDHHDFSAGEFAHFDESFPLLMTEKDAVKCREFARDNMWFVPVSAAIPELQQAMLKEKISKIAIK